jgi:prepilin-type N-terminal cleavage/methylation domain-containing protein
MRGHEQSGFTLLETIVALVVLSMLITGLSQGLRSGLSAWQIQKQTLAARGDLQGTDVLLRNLVARMNPGGVSGQPPAIKGTARSLAFTTTLPQAADALATREADVTLLVDNAHRLQLLWQAHYRNRIRPVPVPERAMLLRDVDHVDFAYWKDASTGWLSEWTGPALPGLLRIRIAFTSASGRHAPDVVIAPARDRWRL